MRLSIGTYNIQHGRVYPHWLETKKEILDFKGMADVIRRMDVSICGLNEVRNEKEGGSVDQAEEIARYLGWNHGFAAAIPIKKGYYGNGLVCKYPILTLDRVPIITLPEERTEGEWYEDRVLLIAKLDIDRTAVTVMSCHFGLNPLEAQRATETVLRESEKINTPLIFMGDLNLTPDSPLIAKLRMVFTDRQNAGEGNMFTFPSVNPNRKIDYIFAKNCRILSSDVPPLVCADHLPVRAEIEL